MNDKERGLYNKYTVINNETGKPVDGETFTLRPDKDEAARHALMTYAACCGNARLAKDILDWLKYLEQNGSE